MVGAGLYIDDTQQAIKEQKNKLQDDIVKQIAFIFLISFFVSLVIINITNIFNKKFTHEFSLFLNFFQNLSLKSDKITVDSLQYSELKELATTANRMLEKQIEIEDERVRTEDLLRSSESNLKEAQKITHFGSWKYNIKNDKLIWSDKVYRIFGLDKNKVSPNYESFLNKVHPDDKTLVNTTYKKSIEEKIPYLLYHSIYRFNLKININWFYNIAVKTQFLSFTQYQTLLA